MPHNAGRTRRRTSKTRTRCSRDQKSLYRGSGLLEDVLRMGSPTDGEPCPARTRSLWRHIGVLLLLLLVTAPMLIACSTDAKATATQSKSKLDSALNSASAAGVPVLRLAPIIAQEETLA